MADQNRTQDNDGFEYVEPDRVPPSPEPDMGIYFSPSDLNRSNTTASGNVVTRQESEGASYDLCGSSGTYKMKAKRSVSQNNQRNQSNKDAGWTMAEKLHITLTAIIMAIAVSALAIALLGLFGGKIHLQIHVDT